MSDNRLVYSTDMGRISQPKVEQEPTAKLFKDGFIRIERQTKGRKGKGVTLIKGLDMDAATLALMGKKLKVMCGSGGTVKEGVIEIQGDHIERILDYLKKQGVRAKRAGG